MAVKIAPFDGLDWARCDYVTCARLLAAGIDRITAVREAIGPDRALLVDCHSRLSPVMARTVLRELEASRIFWLEDPLAEKAFGAATGRALRAFANDRGIRIAGGEHLATMADAREFLAREICDTILPDLRWVGIRTALAMLELAVAWGVEVSLHNPVGPVLDRISLQVAAALPSLLILERQVRESALFEEIGGGPQALTNGAIMFDGSPGFGAPPNRAVLERYSRQNVSRSPSLAGIGGAGGDG